MHELKVNENNNTIEEKIDETEANTTTEETKTTSEASKKKKKKKRDSSTTAETQKAEGVDAKNEKEMTDDKDTTNTEKTASEGEAGKETKVPSNDPSDGPVVSSSKRTRPPYKFDPEKVTLRFLFANRDGLTVTVECKPSDTVGEVKGQLLSVWPDGKIFHLSCMLSLALFIEEPCRFVCILNFFIFFQIFRVVRAVISCV